MLGWGKTTTASQAIDCDRLRQARLSIIAGFLGLEIWLNPSWAVVAIAPFLGPFPSFGRVEPWRLALTVLPHLVTALAAAALLWRYRGNPTGSRRWLQIATVFQGGVGLSWALPVWLLWLPDNRLNHAVVVLLVMAVVWSCTAARTTSWSFYLAGVGPIFASTMLRLASSHSSEAAGLGMLFAFAFAYAVLVAANGKRETERTIVTGIANLELTEELRAARDDALRKRYEAEAANASKTTFLANMSHELRTPLNAILGFSEIIANQAFGAAAGPRYRDYARDINASGHHLLRIIDDILDIANIQTGTMAIEPTNLNPRSLIESALRVLVPRAREKGQKLSAQVAVDACTVQADPRAFKQILMNLVINAIKFTQIGGTIAVHGRRAADGGFELIVEDSGPGIDACLLDKVFQPFNQLETRYSRQKGGTGLGLSLVRGLAELHGGRVWIESERGLGAKVHVHFPARSPAFGCSPLLAGRFTA